MTDPPDLAALRRKQGGAVTVGQALAHGLSKAQIATLVRRRTWLRLEHGVVVESAAFDRASPAEQQALRVAARLLVVDGPHAAARRSASLVLGLPTLGPAPSTVQLVRAQRHPCDRTTTRGVRVAELPTTDVVTAHGVRVTAPARLVCDLAREPGGQLEALMVADASMRAGLDRIRLDRVAERCAGWPGARGLPAVLRLASGRVDSPLESLTRWAMDALGLPPPWEQVDVLAGGSFLGRVDFAWPDLGLVLEADGMGKYRGSDTLVQEKRRELGLREQGVEVVRTSWNEAMNAPEQLGRRWHVHAAFAADRPAPDVVWRLAALEPTGVAGVPFPHRAALPLAA